MDRHLLIGTGCLLNLLGIVSLLIDIPRGLTLLALLGGAVLTAWAAWFRPRSAAGS